MAKDSWNYTSEQDFERPSVKHLGEKYPGITKPGPVLAKGGAKRGRRISKNRTAQDAAQAIRSSMVKRLKEYDR